MSEIRADELKDRLGTGATTAPYGIIGVDSTATFSGARKADITVTVGSGGDYVTINAALAAISQYYPLYVSNGFTPEISLLTGFEIEEQVIVSGVDLSWIILSAVDSNVLVDRTALTVDAGASYGITSYPVFAAIKDGKFPLINNFTIDGQVTLGSATPNDNKMGYFCAGSGSSITGIGTTGALQMSGIACYTRAGGTISAYIMTNSSDSIYACYARSGGTISANTMTNGSGSGITCYALAGGTISANTMTNSSDSSYACYALAGGTISAYTMTNSSDTNYACFARSGIISAYTMTLSNTASSTTYLCSVADGGMVKSGDGTWTDSGSGGKCNVSAGTISANGYVSRIG